ncbi:endonuclease/exonuclease/phosphatase family protein [Corynebacterium glyciniphilum]|uniref:endonuclease/exonuclease/phosphatase family protein n=1 Tax=Corynebacterium glyciniphilum TaxID=1404244 RepID=UPI0011AB37B0|nr:endonuclease/exonuclease/phosphatase family protein [Corynebacterium glyciniphilum]
MTVRRLLRSVPAVAFVLFLVWTSTPLWRVTGALPDRLARFVPAAQAVFAVGALGALLCLIVVCWQAWRRRSAAPAVLAVLLTAAVVTPVGIVTAQSGTPEEGTSGESGETLRVMALNTYFNGADDASIIAESRRIDPDVLVLSETSSAEVDAVERGTGLTSTSPVDDSGRASGTAVLVRSDTPVSDVVEDRGLTGHQTPSARVSVPAPVDVYGVHTLPPAFSDLISRWEDNLGTLKDSFEGSDVPLVLAGDFNATVAHPEFRDFLDHTGLTRCEGGSGIQRLTGTPTWPDRFPLVRIDHVLVRGGACTDGGTVQVEGTDHRGVWADISV